MLTMREIRAKDYGVFPPEISPELLTKQKSMLKYVEHLGALTRSDVSNLKPFEMFGTQGGLIHEDQTKINEAFFAWLAQVAPPVAQSLSDSEADKICRKFDVGFRKQIANIITTVERAAQSAEQDLRNYSLELTKKGESLFRARATVEGLRSKQESGSGVASDLKKLISEAWWSLSDAPQSDSISLLTSEIIMTYVNTKQSINLAVNLGRMQLNIKTNGSSLTFLVEKYDGNPLGSSKHWHPHVGNAGVICSGNMGTALALAASTFSLYEACDIIHKIFTNYNPESPHIHLHALEEAARKGHIFRRAEELAKTQTIREGLLAARFTPPLFPDSADGAEDGESAANFPQSGLVSQAAPQNIESVWLTNVVQQSQSSANQSQSDALDALRYGTFNHQLTEDPEDIPF